MQGLPFFGRYKEIRGKEIEKIQKENITSDPIENRVIINPKKVPSLKELIGSSLRNITTYKELNNQEQVVALINDVCILLI